MELIDRAALIAEYDRVHVGTPGGARKLMEDAPAVDAVPVVRCKDCKYRGVYGECPMYHEEYIEWDDDGYMECEYVPHDNTHDDGFCDCGAKMDGDENEKR
jgi:hypothetical protein